MYRMDCDETVLPLGKVATPHYGPSEGEDVLPAEAPEPRQLAVE
jgi:hypothetical protein